MLNISQLDVGYDESMVLRDIDLRVEPGTVVALLGRNGVGKTTLLKSMMGLRPPQKGSIHFMGEEITSLRPEERAKRGIGYVPQGRDIFSTMTVEENLLLGLEALPGKQPNGTIPEEVFDMFPILREMLHRKGGDLSGGQQQQLAIARALIGKPKLLLLDEPMEGIQPSIVMLIVDVIKRIAASKTVSIVLVEHSLDLALECADYYYVLDKAQIVAEGTAADLNQQAITQHLVV
ncbi:urea ABC transporter ATP-binding subunit UrtE [Ammoniphilus sp. YIM 78166]|uniref:urea ABC transporter ATP-binding subunit UrtE n=1 Tax=Ammoniphilus sp. YIM 78166 TaxID=1644106 RepID=UPI00106F6171|nr:urea ABC transporter ATP-binding subunit UrtE [Ammoniphilus sp. YIM 78166]